MTTAKHTPGPWFAEVHDLPLGKGKVISIQTREKFDTSDDDDDPTLAGIYSVDPVDFANAGLIAASPELLAALKQVNDCLVKCLTGGEVSAKFAGKAIEAAALLIERIEGESK